MNIHILGCWSRVLTNEEINELYRKGLEKGADQYDFDDDDFVPVTGGSDLTDDQLHDGSYAFQNLKVTSDLDRHLVRLLTLHPDFHVEFRCRDLASLDDSTKRDLLNDISDLLGISLLEENQL